MTLTILGILIGSLSGLSALLVALFSRKEAKAKAELTAVDATGKALSIVWETIDRQKGEISSLRDDLQTLDRKEEQCRERLELLRREVIRYKRETGQ